MEKFFLKIATLIIEINIESKYSAYYHNSNYEPFFCKEEERQQVDACVIYKHLQREEFEHNIPDIQWKKVGLAGKCGNINGSMVFLADVYYQGEVVGRKLIMCSGDMKSVDVFIDSSILKDHFYLELMIVMNTILASSKRGALFHCSCVREIMQKKTYLFMGESGAGKSTVAKMYSQHPRYQVLSDDRVVVLKHEDGYYAYGTPWVSDANQRENSFGKIDHIFIIYHGMSNYIKEEPKVLQKRKLVYNIFDFPFWDNKCSRNTLMLCDNMIEKTKVRNLYFTLNADLISFVESLL